jgi:hypothetical protein
MVGDEDHLLNSILCNARPKQIVVPVVQDRHSLSDQTIMTSHSYFRANSFDIVPT